jgi:alpha-L-fucosidase
MADRYFGEQQILGLHRERHLQVSRVYRPSVGRHRQQERQSADEHRPASDGTIPDEVQQVLLAVGAWLKVNGDAIYGTRPWTTYGEGPTKVVEGSFNDTAAGNFNAQDFRFTTKGDTLYAIEMGWPATGEAVIKTLMPIGFEFDK